MMDRREFITNQLKKRLTPQVIKNLKKYSTTIKKIHNNVELLDSYFKEEDIKLDLLDNQNINRSEYSLETSEFIEPDIKKEITESIKYKYTTYYMITIKNKKLFKGEIQFYTKKTIKMNELKKLVRLISSYVLFFNISLNKSRVPLLKLYLTDKKKLMPPPHQLYFTPKNVNSAVTNGIYIVIFRKEEMIKSVLHEVIHYHRIENRNTLELDKYVSYLFKLSQDNLEDLRLYEAQTDFIAIYLNLCFKLSISKKEFYLKEFVNHFIDEIEFMLKQYCKIANHFKFKSVQDMLLVKLKNQNKSKKGKPSLNKNKFTDKNTYSFSYYIIKLFYGLNLPLNNIFSTSEKELIYSIKKTLLDDNFINIVNKCLTKKTKKTKQKKELNVNTLRMSLYG